MALREKPKTEGGVNVGSNATVFSNMGKAKIRNPYADAAELLVDKLVSPEATAEAENKAYESGVDSGGPVQAATRYSVHHGMSLREHFAGLAMQALIGKMNDLSDPGPIAISAYRMADAMIREMRHTRKFARGRSDNSAAPAG